MKKRRCTRFIANCGKGFWTEEKCLNHEEICKCWSYPTNRACVTCKHKGSDSYTLDEQGEPVNPVITCDNPEFIYDTHFNEASRKVPGMCINCPKWESKVGGSDA